MQKRFDELIKSVRGAKRAHRGVIIPLEDGGFYHVINVYDKKDLDGLAENEVFFLSFCSKSEILRLRELRTSHDYLLRLRAMAIVDCPRLCRVFTKRRAKANNWSLTQYYNSRNSSKNHYINALIQKDSKSLKKIASGLAMIKEPNASCKNSLLGNIITVSETLEYFFYFMNLAFYSISLGIPANDAIAALTIAFRIIIGIESLDFDIDSRGIIPQRAEHKIQTLTQQQIEFVYGHEYAHHLMGHVPLQTYSLIDSIIEPDSAKSYSSYSKDHHEEYEADKHAILNIYSNKKHRSKIASASIHVFIYLEFARSLIAHYAKESIYREGSHPSHLDRIDNIMENIDPNLCPSKSDVIAIKDVSDFLKKIAINSIDNHNGIGMNLLSTYGSVYLPTYRQKGRIDRIDF